MIQGPLQTAQGFRVECSRRRSSTAADALDSVVQSAIAAQSPRDVLQDCLLRNDNKACRNVLLRDSRYEVASQDICWPQSRRSSNACLLSCAKLEESDCLPGLDVADEALAFSCCFLYTKNLDSVS